MFFHMTRASHRDKNPGFFDKVREVGVFLLLGLILV